MRNRVLDLIFLIGVIFKGVDGLAELVGGGILCFVGPSRLEGMADAAAAHESFVGPHDAVTILLHQGISRLDSGGTVFLAVYLLLHGGVKLGIVIALVAGSRRVYPWAIVVLVAFVVFQLCQILTGWSVALAALTVFDCVIIVLTWREWRQAREIRDTWRGTVAWVFHRPLLERS